MNETIRGFAQIVASEYANQAYDHQQAADMCPPPALEDIVDAQATSAGLESDDADYLVAVATELELLGCADEAALVDSWKRTTYAE